MVLLETVLSSLFIGAVLASSFRLMWEIGTTRWFGELSQPVQVFVAVLTFLIAIPLTPLVLWSWALDAR